MNTVEEKAHNILIQHDIRVSSQRLRILDYLITHDTHPTADEIYTALKNTIPVISMATVYNTLNLFVEKQLLSTMSANHSEMRYDLLVEEHGHFVCEKCNKIYNFSYNYHDKYSDLEGFDINQAEIVLTGICQNCKNN